MDPLSLEKQVTALLNNVQPDVHLLHVLHDAQQALQCIPPAAVPLIASKLGIPISQVQAVIEFYAFFQQTARGEYRILFSNCPQCGYQAGGNNLLQHLRSLLKVEGDATRADGRVSIDQTSCIGMCDHGPSLLVNGIPVIGLDAEKLQQLTVLIERQTPLASWPAAWLQVMEQIRLPGLLLQATPLRGEALQTAMQLGTDGILHELTQSGLRGRGGAGFTTAQKWQMSRDVQSAKHFVVCNADEGEPGTFKDRALLHLHADTLFEGMTLCALAIGAEQGFLYLRGEYRYLLPQLQQKLAQRRSQGLLGKNILGHASFSFDIEIVVGAGAYICGEESALIESLEGKRGIPRVRPPFPVSHGYRGYPTVVNNVETFIAAAQIIRHGSAWFRACGTAQSAGSKLLSISGDCVRPGVYEYPFGISLAHILQDCGATDVQAVQLGGAAGTLLSPDQFSRTLCFEDLSTSGSLMVIGKRRNLLAFIQNFAHFFAHESCGFCTPCRTGSALLSQYLDKLAAGHATCIDMEQALQVCNTASHYSHCGLGKSLGNPLMSLQQFFPELTVQCLLPDSYTPQFDLDAALSAARQITHREDEAAHLANGYSHTQP